MAREHTEHRNPRKSYGDVPDRSPEVKSKFSKFSKAQETALLSIIANGTNDLVSSSVQRSVREAVMIERSPKFAMTKTPKVKDRISIAGVFKKAKYQAREKKQRRVREHAPDPELFIDFQDGLETAYAALNANSKLSFDSVRTKFNEQLATSRSSDGIFIKLVSIAANKLSTPLLHEQIEIESMKNGKPVKETVTIGKRVTQFMKILEKEDAKLHGLWKQWDEMQNEYIELGIDVFGARAFGQEVPREKERANGFTREMELVELEHSGKVDELNDEVKEIRVKVMQRMKSSEKDLDAAMKKEQARLLKALIGQ